MSGMTNWPQHFIDAGFTDAEIVPGVAYPRWRFYEGDFWLTSKPGCMVLEWQHSINHRMTIAIDPDGVVYTSYNKAAIWPMSLSLAHQAAEDLVCRLHGVPTAAEREIERLKRVADQARLWKLRTL